MSKKLKEIYEELQLELLTPEIADLLDREVSEGYVSDLLSDVLANAKKGSILITLQTHINVIAVCVHAEISAVIFIQNRHPDDNVMKKAEQEKILLFSSSDTAFNIVGKLYELGIRG
ncbi:MAG: serine kinase [Candidatus Hydrogenedens sp.]